MKKLGIGFWMAGVLSVVGASSAQAAMMGAIRPALVGGINDMTNNGGTLGFTGGLDLAFWLGPMADLTVGAEYLSRAFTGASNVAYLHVPALLNLHMGPMFHIGGGGFYDFALTSGAPVNYGLTGAVRLKPALVPVFLEGRYNYGLNTTDFGSNTSEFQLLLGIIF